MPTGRISGMLRSPRCPNTRATNEISGVKKSQAFNCVCDGSDFVMMRNRNALIQIPVSGISTNAGTSIR